MSAPEHKTTPETRWLSSEFSELVSTLNESTSPFDVVIIGSGYGGAIAADELSRCIHPVTKKALNICLLERGKEYLPGMFPSQLSELPTHARISTPAETGGFSVSNEGLFDIRFGRDVSTIIASGLGGGSLINAGVMEIPRREIFSDQWPRSLRDYESLLPYYHEAKQRLGASHNGQDNTINSRAEGTAELQKTKAFRKLAAGSNFREAAVTIAMQDKLNKSKVHLDACRLCGDCATGCNYNAKESLDTNLLVNAARNGVKIYTGSTVLRIDRDQDGHGWRIFANYTNKNLRERQGLPVQIKAKRIILAAGTLGSSEILLKSQKESKQLRFSEKLGHQFSTNGDMIATGFGQNDEVNAVADENCAPAERNIGPSITSIIDIDASGMAEIYNKNMVLEELAIPGPLRWIFEQSYSTARTLEWLAASDNSRHLHEHPLLDPYAINPAEIRNTQIYAAMADDGACGKLTLKPGDGYKYQDGGIEITWADANHLPPFSEQIKTLRELEKNAGVGGHTIGNPMWKILPDSMDFLIDNRKGPLLTVHPLGGCPMGDSAQDGVVNEYGEVFDVDTADAKTVHEGLVVLDGSIVPTALCTNPALTIAALTLRAIRVLQTKWSLSTAADEIDQKALNRPAFRDAEQEIINRPTPVATIAEFTERLTGPVDLEDQNGKVKRYITELTLHYEHKAIADLVHSDSKGKLADPVLALRPPSDPRHSQLRIFDFDKWHELRNSNCTQQRREALLHESALFIAPLGGTLTVFRRDASSACRRRARGLWAWWRNRGLRDLWQFSCNALCGKKTKNEYKSHSERSGFWQSAWQRAQGAWKLASHAGETRLFEYDLQIHEPFIKNQEFFWPEHDQPSVLRGAKYISYRRPSNPWRQLMEMTVLEMPRLRAPGNRSILYLDNRYMASVGAPLFKIIKQQDQVKALTDVASVAMYIARMLFSIHIWNARAPEPPIGKPKRLPGKLPEIPEPEIHRITVDETNGKKVEIQLTHYPACSADAQPVIAFHGYSASGTTFAHHAVPTDITRFLHEAGRDIWIADLRTSCGMPTAIEPWTFETVGLKDIPAAIDYVYRKTGKPIDVLAHCMGAIMFSMAVLSANRPAEQLITDWDEGFTDDFLEQRKALPSRIRRVVFSQVGPLVVFSPRNVFSAFVTNYLRNFLPLENYQFRPSQNPELVEQVMDRLLATLPYPDDEFLKENPAWPPWKRTEYIGTRHRMDALYGRDFNLLNLNDETLRHIDDFFGPLNADTVSQAIHFNRLQMLTNRFGRNSFLSKKLLRECWTFPTMSIHGEENGLSDIATLERMKSELEQSGRIYRPMAIKGYGHQDCWIGQNAGRDVFPLILDFLNDTNIESSSTENTKLIARTPWAGPVLGLDALDLKHGKRIPVALSARPSLGKPVYVALIPVARQQTDGTSGNHQWCAVYQQSILPGTAVIPEQAMQIITIDEGSDDWIQVKLSPDLFQQPAEGVAILTIHDQSPTLASSNFNENF